MPFVQGTGIESAGSVASVSKAFVSNTTAGNHVAVGAISSGRTAWTAARFSDSQVGTYALDVNVLGVSTSEAVAIGHRFAVTGGALTCTLTPPSADFVSIGIAEMSLTSAAAAPTATVAANTSTPATGNLITGAQAVILAILTQSGGTITIVENGTYTLIFKDTNSANMPISWIYKDVAAGTYTASWTVGAVQDCAGVAVAFTTSGSAATVNTECMAYLPPRRGSHNVNLLY